MRVGIVVLMHESNTFLAEKTGLAHFEQDLLAEGEDVRARLATAHHESGGFFQGLAEVGIDAVPIFAARALPYGPIETEAFRSLVNRLETAIQRAGPLDGLLVAPHGAAVCESIPDANGHWLSRVRALVGPAIPIVGTLDLHANVSAAMVEACDALIAYRTNPHLDQRARGRDAALLLARTLRGQIRPVMAAEFPPLAINIERQLTAEPPCRPLYDAADRMLGEAGVLSNSLTLGFPYADVAEMGPSVLVVADGDRNLARRKAGELAQTWWGARADFVGQLTSVEDAVRRAAGLEGPVCLLDMGDNIGGGSPADGTWLIHEVVRQGVLPAFACLYDPAAVACATATGISGCVEIAMGGHCHPEQGTPYTANVSVRGLFEGRFDEPQPRHGGITQFDQGPTAVVETAAGLTLMLTSRRMVPFSLRQMTAFGLDPGRFRILIAKGVHAPVAAYAPVSKALIRVDTPGLTSADLNRFPYQHRRRPMFPFEPETTFAPGRGPF